MFTGLIQTTGEICGRELHGEAGKLRVKPHRKLSGLTMGESIAVNGTCLTLEQDSGGVLTFHVMQESFHRTNLGSMPLGSLVNMERALAVGDRLGGHLVSGHVDATGRILSFGRVGSDMELCVELPDAVAAYLVPKGSICIDGISLTIASLTDSALTVCIIPTTWNETNLRTRRKGDLLNLEADMLGKYVRHQLEAILGKTPAGNATNETRKSLDMMDLINAGF